MSDAIQLREWSRLEFYDPELVLRALRPVQEALAQSDLDSQIRSLRTHGLKTERERWEAAVFAYGMSVAVVGVNVLLSPVERSDYDFVTSWEVAGTRHFCPVQLKEWVPPKLNPAMGFPELLSSLKRHPTSQRTVVAIHLNRDFDLDLAQLPPFQLDLAEVWLFGAASPDQSEWMLCGNLLRDPVIHRFRHPAFWPPPDARR